MYSKKNIEDQILVIFGSNGDLARRKLIPAVFQLFLDNLLPAGFIVIGAGSQDKTADIYRKDVEQALREFAAASIPDDAHILQRFLQQVYYIRVQNKVDHDFKRLQIYIRSLSGSLNIRENIVYYFSIPPFMYETVAANLVSAGLNNEENGWKRIIVEKPFGYSYETAVDLDKKLHAGFNEEQIYRIDHYLGKETVQNILVTRFYNGFFEPIWNRKYIDRVEITAAEKIGVSGRGGYYDTSGAMRDMIQNHLLQVMAVVAMEPPAIFDSDSIRNETVKVLQALRPIKGEDVAKQVVRGQYAAATGVSKAVAYRDEEGVANDSQTETYVAIKAYIDNWRWGDVPFYIRTGKHMPERVTEVVIHLKHAPHQLFKQLCLTQPNNMIILRIHPDAGVAIDFGMKIPGAGYKVHNVDMAFRYADLAETKIPEAYERLLLDCMAGDSTLYARADAVKASWKFVDPILEAWKSDPAIPLCTYPAGSWGPAEANQLFNDPFTGWREPGATLKNEQ